MPCQILSCLGAAIQNKQNHQWHGKYKHKILETHTIRWYFHMMEKIDYAQRPFDGKSAAMMQSCGFHVLYILYIMCNGALAMCYPQGAAPRGRVAATPTHDFKQFAILFG